MLLTRSFRRVGSWLAMFAMALSALWPLLALAKPAQDGGSLIEICASTGMKWIAADGSEQQPAHINLGPHCAFCSLGADRTPLPSSRATAPVPVSIAVAVAVVVRGQAAPVVTQSFPSPALPRAPPVLS